ncbi:unannotated protein [freshwater metagenome]|uniref:Unannotated protein n=1 Tax=freshwater metagenome TaxID=449393 RepID=A0A6J6VB97_9ZZZZ
MIAVVTHLCWQVERTTEACLAGFEQKLESLVGVGCAAEARILAHCPEAIAMHCWINAAGVWRLAGGTQLALGIEAGQRLVVVQRLDGDSRVGLAG